MMLPIAMAQLLGNQHRNDMLTASGRWRNCREARLAKPARFRRQPAAPRTPPVTIPAATGRAAGRSPAVAPEQSSIEVRRPLVRS